MFVNIFSKEDNWIKENKAYFNLLDDFGVGVAVINHKMEIIALNKVMRKWFPNVDIKKLPICYRSFNNPPRDMVCSYCPTIKALADGKVHEAVTETPTGDKIINYRVVSSPIKDKTGKIIAAIEVVENITNQMLAGKRLEKLNECLLDFGPDYEKNIKSLTAICGELLGATCALYNRFEKNLMCSIGQWNVPDDYVSLDKAEGHICFDVVLRAKDQILVVRDLQKTKYRQSDPNVARYNLQTYMGKAVKCYGKFVGSVCVAYQNDFVPSEEDKKFLGIIASAISVEEERKLKEGQIDSIERQQKAILDNIPDIAWLKDRESRFIAVNEPFGRACGLTPEEIVGKDDFDIWPKGLAESYRSDDKEVMRTDKRKIIEEPLADKEGKVQWVETIKTPIYDAKGEIIGTTGIARDMTHRRELESQLKTSEEKYRKLFEGAIDAIFIADIQTGRIIDANKQAEKLLDRSREEILRMHQTQLHPQDDIERYKEIFRRHAAQQDASAGTVEAEVLNKAGEKIPVLISASVLEIAGRKVLQGIFRNISALRKIEGEKKEAEALALIDPHTQLYNYRYLQRRIRSEFEEAKRRATPLSLLMMDLDYFKSINDTYGHEFGDTVLQEFALLLQHACREIDVVTRFEGEGFAIILPDTDGKGVYAFAERVQNMIKKHKFGKYKVRLMVSIGIASYPEDDITTVDKLLTNVDNCVRMAKEKGGNSICICSQMLHKKPAGLVLDNVSKERVKEISRKFTTLMRHNKQNTIEAVYALAHAVGAKNAYTEEHSEDMIYYATEIGKKLDLSEEELEDLKHGAMLHDIGKLGISDRILLKPGKLTKKEFETIKKHPQIGADIIRPVHFLKNVVPIILHHHERYDGYGYGSKLKGDEIPLGARIVAIVDVYQALVSNRPYRKAFSKKEAQNIIKEEAGRHFDPKIAKVFLDILAKEKRKKSPSKSA